jgi:hypothetical protein
MTTLSAAEEARIKEEKGWGWPFVWLTNDGWYYRTYDDDEDGPHESKAEAERQCRNEAAYLEQKREVTRSPLEWVG